MSKEELFKLIHEYRSAVDRAARLLVQEARSQEPLACVRSQKFPPQGTLPGGTYRFHGVGCEVQIDDVTVDFDWGPSGRYGGFDAWRLSLFAEQRGHVVDEHAVATALAEFERAGLIEAPKLEPSPHLYYLRPDS